jgi:hypothetical protein
VRIPEIVKGKRGNRFGKWTTMFTTDTFSSAMRMADTLNSNTPYKIMYGGKRVD